MLGGSSDQGNAQNGGSSDQGNAVQVRVLDRFGAPVAHASLEILPEGWLPSTTGSTTPGAPTRILADDSGFVRVRLASGRYSLKGSFEHLSSLQTVQIDDDRRLDFVLRAASDIVGTLTAGQGIDTLYLPGTRLYTSVQPDGSFRLDSIPQGADILSTRDGRTIRLDTTGSGFVRVYRDSFVPGGSIPASPDTLIPKYFATRTSALILEPIRPSEVLESWVPDSVWVSGDSLWISSLVRSCDALPRDGLAAWWHAESLEVFKRPCPDPPGEPVRHLFHQTPRRGIWTVGTLQPFGYTWEIP